MFKQYGSKQYGSKRYQFWIKLAGLTLVVIALLTTWMVASLAITPA